MPQPYLVPVKPRFSRRTQSRGVEGSTSRFTRCRFTVKEIIGALPLKHLKVAILKQVKNITPICTASPDDVLRGITLFRIFSMVRAARLAAEGFNL
jgi:hypothetical protein